MLQRLQNDFEKLKAHLPAIFIITAIVSVVDQLTKRLVLEYIPPGAEIEIVPGFFNLTLTFNPGAAFGIMAGFDEPLRRILLTTATVFALLVVCYLFLKEYSEDRMGLYALSLVLGGALGNVVDRATTGLVVDFLDVYYNGYHWPAFNVADSAICVGVVVLVLKSLREGAPSTEPGKS